MANIRVSIHNLSWIRPKVRYNIWRRWWRHRLSGEVVAALVFLAVVGLGALFAPYLANRDPLAQNLIRRLQPPQASWGTFFLGTDPLGRDLGARLLYGARFSLGISLSAGVLAAALGTVIGTWAGWRRGLWDRVISGIINMQLSLPFLLVALTLASVARPGVLSIIAVLTATGWASFARLARAESYRLANTGYIEAARAIGQSELRVLVQHLLPNLLPTVLVLFSLELSRFIVLESSLSFLGVGVDTATPTWGGMISEGREYLATHYWLSTLPGLLVFFTCLSLNIVGDWVQEILSPYARRKEVAKDASS